MEPLSSAVSLPKGGKWLNFYPIYSLFLITILLKVFNAKGKLPIMLLTATMVPAVGQKKQP